MRHALRSSETTLFLCTFSSDVFEKMPGLQQEPKLRVEGSSDETCATFIVREEDHTLGNALRYVMAKRLVTVQCICVSHCKD